MSDFNTRNMLKKIRSVINEQNKIDIPDDKTMIFEDNINNRFNILMEEAERKANKEPYVISSSNVQFGTVRSSQEDGLRKTIGDVVLKSDALKYYPNIQDLVLNGEVSGIGVSFQFRYKDPSGDGCYIWAEGLQMSDANLKTIEKIRDAFLNWKQSLVEDGDLLQKLDKEANKEI